MPTLYDSNSLAAKSPLLLVVPDRVMLMFPVQHSADRPQAERISYAAGRAGGHSNILMYSMEQSRHEKNLSTKQYQTKTDTRIFDSHGDPRRA
jgi:hypothetical protein